MRGCDCSTAFEVHHLDIAKARAVLSKYELRDHPSSLPLPDVELSDYNWGPNNGFSRLREATLEALRNGTGERNALKATGPSHTMVALSALTVIFYLFSLVMVGLTGQWGFVFMAGLGTHWLLGVGHNFFHKADTWWPLRRAFDLTGKPTVRAHSDSCQ